MVNPLPHQDPILLARVLNDPAESANLLPGQIDLLIQLGALASLEAEASQSACGVLAQAAANHPIQIIREHAYTAILRLSANGNPIGVNALYYLALEYDHLAARQQIVATGLLSENLRLNALLEWFLSLDDQRSVHLKLAAGAYFEDISPALRARVLYAASRSTRYRGWGRLLENLSSAKTEGYAEAVDQYPNLTEQEREIFREYLFSAGENDLDAREALISLFIQHDDILTRDRLLANGWAPQDLNRKALFLFLIGRSDAYRELDFDHNLLVGAYETASKSLRRRILEYSRKSGQIEWLRAVSQAADIRYLTDLGDADWETSINRLFENERHADLWRLSLAAPALWSAAILARLGKTAWKPAAGSDLDGFNTLCSLASACAQRPLDLRPATTIHAPGDDLTCLALSPSFNMLAGGTSGQHIYLWQLPDGALRYPALIGPATVTRALAFSPDGEHLVAADGDKRIRIFRYATGQVIKTIEGHRGLVRAIAIHPSGRVLVSAGFDGQIRTWRFPLGTELKRMDTDIRENFCLAILADGETIVSAGLGDNLSLWRLNEGILLRRIPTGSDGIVHLAAAHGSELFASVGRDRVISVWNATSGLLVRRFSIPSAAVTGLAFFPGDQMLVSSSQDGALYLWSLSSNEPVARLKSHSNSIVSFVLAPDGQTLISADSTGEIKCWPFSTLIWIREPFLPGRHLPYEHLQERLKESSVSPNEKHWLEFTAELWKWSRRFDIEIGEPFTIHLGEYDIEL